MSRLDEPTRFRIEYLRILRAGWDHPQGEPLGPLMGPNRSQMAFFVQIRALEGLRPGDR